MPDLRTARLLRTAAIRLALALAATASPSMLGAQGAVASTAASAALTPADLLDVRTVSAGDYSPDGRWLVVRLARRGDGLSIHLVRHIARGKHAGN